MDSLTTIAEVAVAFVGFASIVSVLGRGSQVSGFHRASLRGMVLSGFAVVLCSFAPIVPEKFGVSAQAGWRISSTFLLVVIVLLTLAAARDGSAMRGAGVALPVRLAGALQLLVPGAFATLGASGLYPEHAEGFYLLALLLLLLLSGSLFAGIILTYIAPTPAKSATQQGIEPEVE